MKGLQCTRYHASRETLQTLHPINVKERLPRWKNVSCCAERIARQPRRLDRSGTRLADSTFQNATDLGPRSGVGCTRGLGRASAAPFINAIERGVVHSAADLGLRHSAVYTRTDRAVCVDVQRDPDWAASLDTRRLLDGAASAAVRYG